VQFLYTLLEHSVYLTKREYIMEKDKEEDIIEIFLLITDEDIEKAVNKTAYIKSYKDVKKLVENYEGM